VSPGDGGSEFGGVVDMLSEKIEEGVVKGHKTWGSN
jgi:hypothetical protein